MNLEKINNQIKRFNLAFLRRGVFVLLMSAFSFNLIAQCPLGCNNNVQISLGGDCTAIISPDVVLEGMGSCTNDNYDVTITMPDGSTLYTTRVGAVITHPSVGVSNVGQTLKVRVNDITASNGLNSCWGNISIEDKLAPTLTCPNDITVDCNDVATSIDLTHSERPNVFSYNPTDSLTIDGIKVPYYEANQGGATSFGTDGQRMCQEIVVNNFNQFDIVNSIRFELLLSQLTINQGTYTVEFRDPNGDLVDQFPGETNRELYTIENPTYLNVQGSGSMFNGTWQICVQHVAGTEDIMYRFRGISQLLINSSGFFTNQMAPGNALSADNCNTVSLTTLSDDMVDIGCSDVANPGISAIRTITTQASDASGNASNICTTRIFYARKMLSDIVWPDNYSAECVSNIDGTVDPTATSPATAGMPTIGGVSIHPNEGQCEIDLTYTDDSISVCGASYKLLRNWIALDWCEATSTTNTQIIKIDDSTGPVIAATIDQIDNEGAVSVIQKISADPYTCTTTWPVPAPVQIYDCALSAVTYTVGYAFADSITGLPPENTVFISDNVRAATNPSSPDILYEITGLPVGLTWIQYVATDACGNSSKATTEVEVVDLVPPTPVCDQNTVVTLNSNEWAHIFASSFDDGSYDNCDKTTLKFGVRKINNFCSSVLGTTLGSNPTAIDTSEFSDSNLPGPTYYDFVKFCCEDVGREDVMVEMIVYDSAGNWNTCTVNVRVDNNVMPTVTINPVDSIRNNQFVTIDCMDDIPVAPNMDDIFILTNTNCEQLGVRFVRETIGTPLECGEYSISRTYEAYSLTTSNRVGSAYSQTIRISNVTPFDLDNHVLFPDDMTFTGCLNVDTDPANPSGPGVPTYTGDTACSQLAYTYKDQVFNFVEDACFKILRTWTVIDWCTYNQNQPDGDGIKQHTQIIKINNSSAPVFTSCSTLSFSGFEDNCQATITLMGSAADDCTPMDQIVFSYEIDLNNDGTGADISNNGNDASGTYDIGTHSITWTAEDQCGNISMCTQLFVVRDAKNPTPYCIGGSTTVVMPSTGTVTIWASDFNIDSYDNCTSKENLRYSFSPSTANTNRTFGCDELGTNMVQIWITDESGNQDFCETMVDIQNTGGCENTSPRVQVGGRISTNNGENVEAVAVMLEDMETYIPTSMVTQDDGLYAFSDNTTGRDYQVMASRNDNHMNGVSTLDLVIIQKHILGVEIIDSPYKVVAADINKSNSISATDLIELRKLILGIYDEFPNNQSWRFINAEQVFEDIISPWPLQESITLAQLNNDDLDNNFKAIKIGDVNESADPNTLQSGNIENRSSKVLNLQIANQVFKEGERVEVVFTSENFNKIVGLQYTLSFDEMSLQYEGVSSEKLNITSNNVNAQKSDLGVISFSWSDYKANSLEENQEVFTISFRAKTNNVLTNVIYGLSSELTQTEAYTSNLDIINLNLEVVDQETVNGFALEQNTPNPFNSDTQIAFTLPEAMPAMVSIYNVEGRELFTLSKRFNKGYNAITVDLSSLTAATGIFYYRLQAGDYSATRKMILIQ